MKPIKVLFPYSGFSIGGSVVSGSLLAKTLGQSPFWNVMMALPGEGSGAQLFQGLGLPIHDYGFPASSVRRISKASGVWGKMMSIPAYIRLYRRARRVLLQERPDIVHVNDDRSLLAWGWAAKRLKIPVVWHIRQERGNWLMDSWRLRLAKCLIFVAENNRIRFSRFKQLPPNVTIHNGVDLSCFYPGNKAEYRKRLGFPEDGLLVGFVGNLVGRKRPQWFVEAAISCLRRGVNAHFILVGEDFSEGAYEKKLRTMTENARFASRFSYLGYREDTADIFRGLDMLVLTSERHGEAFPRVIIEAMASGVPVVATSVAGVPEAVIPQETGLLCDPDEINELKEKMFALLTDDALRQKMAETAPHHAKKRFSSDEVCRKVEQFYGLLTPEAEEAWKQTQQGAVFG